MYSDFAQDEEGLHDQPFLTSAPIQDEPENTIQVISPRDDISITSSSTCPGQCRSCRCDETIKRLFSNDLEDEKVSCCENGSCGSKNCIGSQISTLCDFKLVLKDVKHLLSTFNESAEDILKFVQQIDGVKIAVFDKMSQNYIHVHGKASVLHVIQETKKKFKACAFVKFTSDRVVIFDVLDNGIKCEKCCATITKEMNKLDVVNATVATVEDKRVYLFTYAEKKYLMDEMKKIGKIVGLPQVGDDLISFKFDVQGMKCGNCVSKVMKTVTAIPGVSDAQISLEDKELVVQTIKINPVNKNIIMEQISELGYKIKPKETPETPPLDTKSHVLEIAITPQVVIQDSSESFQKAMIRIEEMSCSSCISKIESWLKKKRGIQHVSINLLLKKAEVDYDQNLITEAEIVTFITDLGYPSTSITDQKMSKGSLFLTIDNFSQNNREASNLLTETPGILSCTPNPAKSLLEVKFDESLIARRGVIKVITRFGAKVYNPKDEIRISIMREDEKRHWMRLFIFSSLLTIPVLIVDMILGKIPAIEMVLMGRIFPTVNFSWMSLIMIVLVTPVQFIGGWPFYKLAWAAIRNWSADMNVLIAIGTWEAYLYSLFAIIYSIIYPDFEGGQFMETAAALIMFLSLGRWLESIAKAKTSASLLLLMDLAPSHAILVEVDEHGNEKDIEIQTELITKHDVLKVHPGTKIPTDGVIISGSSGINEAMITGEYVPVSKNVGDKVIGGTLNIDGLLFIRCTQVGDESTLNAIAKLVEEAQTKKPNIQKLADRISGWFTYLIIVISIIVFVLWFVLSITNAYPSEWRPANMNSFVFALLLSSSTVVIACPCALGLATPTAIMVGTGLAASSGILIKGGEVLETANKANAILFDKTGTLTLGQLTVNNVIFLEEIPQDFYMLLGSVESSSTHPIARAIVAYCKGKTEHHFKQPTNFASTPGRGIKCDIGDVTLSVGNEAFMQQEGITTSHSEDVIYLLKEAGDTLVYVAIKNKLIAVVGLSDVIKPAAKGIIERLKTYGINVFMVTGDNERAAHHVAKIVGIPPENVFASVLPDGKVSKVRMLQEKKQIVIMVGDGINDSPSLTQADVGIAVGEGTDIALESADIVLMKNDMEGIIKAIDISRRTYRRIILNFVWALGYNMIAVPFAGGLFWLITHVMIPPWIAGVAMVLSSISVLVSSLTLGFIKC